MSISLESTVALHDNVDIPLLGLGVFRVDGGAAVEAAHWAKKQGLKVTLVDKAAMDRSGALAPAFSAVEKAVNASRAGPGHVIPDGTPVHYPPVDNPAVVPAQADAERVRIPTRFGHAEDRPRQPPGTTTGFVAAVNREASPKGRNDHENRNHRYQPGHDQARAL